MKRNFDTLNNKRENKNKKRKIVHDVIQHDEKDEYEKEEQLIFSDDVIIISDHEKEEQLVFSNDMINNDHQTEEQLIFSDDMINNDHEKEEQLIFSDDVLIIFDHEKEEQLIFSDDMINNDHQTEKQLIFSNDMINNDHQTELFVIDDDEETDEYPSPSDLEKDLAFIYGCNWRDFVDGFDQTPMQWTKAHFDRVVYHKPTNSYWLLDQDDKPVEDWFDITSDDFANQSLWEKVEQGQPQAQASSRSETLEDCPAHEFTTYWTFS